VLIASIIAEISEKCLLFFKTEKGTRKGYPYPI